jgi:hypothetical protein
VIEIDEATLERAIRSVAGEDVDRVRSELARYGVELQEREQRRVQLAILKLVSEDGLDRLGDLVDAAKRDYRDVLAWAEYPAQMRAPIKQTPEESLDTGELDAEQYSRWIKQFLGGEG